MIWPLVAYFEFVVVLVATILIVSSLLGQRHFEPATGTAPRRRHRFEGSARVVFGKLLSGRDVLRCFDLEAVFLFAWAARLASLGWAGYLEVVLFVGVLVAALIYLWKVGALDWARGTAASRR
jgi:NADH-quinone oxidoreductase subunit A